MTTKIVSQLDAQGLFVGPTLADASPLEHGVWLLPAGAVDVLPPEVPEGRKMFWDGQAFVLVPLPEIVPEPEPEPPGVPQIVTMRQARLALLGAGLLGAVATAIDALPEPNKSVATIEWEYSQEVHRDRALIQVLGPMLGLDDAQMDALFVAAAAL